MLQDELSDARRLWEERGWDYAYIGVDPAAGSDEIYVTIYNADNEMVWAGTHKEFVAWSDRMKIADGENAMAVTRAMCSKYSC